LYQQSARSSDIHCHAVFAAEIEQEDGRRGENLLEKNAPFLPSSCSIVTVAVAE
jgi:hypothetical protein